MSRSKLVYYCIYLNPRGGENSLTLDSSTKRDVVSCCSSCSGLESESPTPLSLASYLLCPTTCPFSSAIAYPQSRLQLWPCSGPGHRTRGGSGPCLAKQPWQWCDSSSPSSSSTQGRGQNQHVFRASGQSQSGGKWCKDWKGVSQELGGAGTRG